MRFGDSIGCPRCGRSFSPTEMYGHRCNWPDVVEHQMRLAGPGIERLERDFADYLASPHGRFERYYAARRPTSEQV